MQVKEEIVVAGKKISFDIGKVARQADGAVLITIGETVILAACAVGPVKKEFQIASFVPLTVDYREKTYAAGKIPGGFFKREGKPREKEILACRLVDRSIRPLLSKRLGREVLVQIMVLSSDGKNDTNIPAMIGAFTALMVSSIPFKGPLGAVSVGYKDGKYIINPLSEELTDSKLDMIVAGNMDSILMVESGSSEISEDIAVGALKAAQEEIRKICDIQNKIAKQIGKQKLAEVVIADEEKIRKDVQSRAKGKMADIALMKEKGKRNASYDALQSEICEALKEAHAGKEDLVKYFIEECLEVEVRNLIVHKGLRADGRGTDDIRPISGETSFLPRTHGSALFTRGETQSLGTVTLGTASDMQIIDGLEEEYKERFMLHYNFPGIATGEPKGDRGPGRREIGHGALAKRALYPMIPSVEDFCYTIRIVSEILESNGSSSMASVCSGSLALFDAGVPVKSAVSGIAMGLIMEGSGYKILTDIMGLEDHYGDMDLKAAGTKDGLTALQMDIKVEGLPIKIIEETLHKAKIARLKILDIMNGILAKPRSGLSVYAPRIVIVMIPQDKIGALIGPGGKNIKKIIEASQAEIEVDDDGKVFISSDNADNLERAKQMVQYFTAEVEVGKIYKGKVVKIAKFGAFVEILPGKDGLLHISQISKKRVECVEDVLKEGDIIEVQVAEIDSQGRVNLTCKDLAEK